jgi:hypothetical protein
MRPTHRRAAPASGSCAGTREHDQSPPLAASSRSRQGARRFGPSGRRARPARDCGVRTRSVTSVRAVASTTTSTWRGYRSTPGAAVSWLARRWLLWRPSGRAVAPRKRCSDSSKTRCGASQNRASTRPHRSLARESERLVASPRPMVNAGTVGVVGERRALIGVMEPPADGSWSSPEAPCAHARGLVELAADRALPR